MFVTGPGQIDHHGYVAGRYRNGALSDGWTDVTRCAERTFVGYVPACSCGWTGTGFPATTDGHVACGRAWLAGHVAGMAGERRRVHVVGEPSSGRVVGGALTP